MNDREVAHHADDDVVRFEVRDRHRLRRQPEESIAIEERAVGLRAEEILGEDLAEPPDIRHLNGPDVVAIEIVERLQISTDLRAAAGRDVVRPGFDHRADLAFLIVGRDDDVVLPSPAFCHSSITA